MKHMKRDMKDMVSPMVAEKSDYPYGLCIHLDKECLDKLGMEELPDPGAVMEMKAKVMVKSKSEHESLEGGEYYSLDLQITDMELGKPKQDVEKKLYSDSE